MRGNSKKIYLEKGLILPLLIFLFLILSFSFASAGLTTDLRVNYAMNDSSGTTMNDTLGVYNVTSIGTGILQQQPGIQNKAFLFYNNTTGINASIGQVTSDAYTFSFWYKTNSTELDNDAHYFINLTDAADTPTSNAGDLNASCPLLSDNQWHNILIQQGHSNFFSSFSIYQDGNFCGTEGISWTATHVYRTSAFIRVANFFSSGAKFYLDVGNTNEEPGVNSIFIRNVFDHIRNITLDEPTLWTRLLTESEIDAIYNNGLGASYPYTDVPPTAKVPSFVNSFVNDTLSFSMNNYFENYQNITINYSDLPYYPHINLTAQLSGSSFTNSTGSLSTSLIPSASDITLTFINIGNAFGQLITVNASNQYGYVIRSFTLSSSGFNTTTQSQGLLGGVVNTFNSLFPDSSGLTGTQKIGFVVVSMILITVLIIMIAGTENTHLSIYVALIMDFLLFIYFVVKGYVSIGILIFIVLVAIGLSYLKFRGGS